MLLDPWVGGQKVALFAVACAVGNIDGQGYRRVDSKVVVTITLAVGNIACQGCRRAGSNIVVTITQ